MCGTVHHKSTVRITHSTRLIIYTFCHEHRCEPVYGMSFRREKKRAAFVMRMHVRTTPTACAPSEPHEPEHQAWAGSLLICCNIQEVHRIYVTSLEFHRCQILFSSKPVVRAIEVSIPLSLQRWVSIKSPISQLCFFKLFF